VEVLREDVEVQGAIALAERDFALDTSDFESGPVSVGIQPEPGDKDLVARVRIFRGDRSRDGQPPESATLETRVKLPSVGEEGITHVFVTLRTDNVGTIQEEDAVVVKESELPSSSLVRSWKDAERVPCTDEPQDGEVCIPGGAFWLGDVSLTGNDDIADADEERLVVMPPFFIDSEEVTVEDFRKVADELDADGYVLPPEWNGETTGETLNEYATYTSGPSPDDPDDEHKFLPVTAILWETANAYCEHIGKQLPTEAMFEFLASGRGLEHLYPWGNDLPKCGDVVFGQAGTGIYPNFSGECRAPDSRGGPRPPQSGPLDEITVDGEAIYDLGGNVSEWSRDWFYAQSTGPFENLGVLYDPEATTEPRSDTPARTVKGGSWRGEVIQLQAASRANLEPDIDNRSVGFRCARRDDN
jgi:formylglycine-generating enzyme required for sulfatase activity